MKEPVVFDIIVGLVLLCAAFGIGLRIGKASMQNELHQCKTTVEIYEHDFDINKICADKFEQMSC